MILTAECALLHFVFESGVAVGSCWFNATFSFTAALDVQGRVLPKPKAPDGFHLFMWLCVRLVLEFGLGVFRSDMPSFGCGHA